MELKEEFRTYESLRREHDTQIVQIATEAGLRIAPDQWSSLLYGDTQHKSHMQSIIDKLQTPQSFGQGVQELVLGNEEEEAALLLDFEAAFPSINHAFMWAVLEAIGVPSSTLHGGPTERSKATKKSMLGPSEEP